MALPPSLWERNIASSTRRPLRRRLTYTFGTAPRYFSNLRAPGYVNQDLAIQKWFTLKERLRMQIAVQMFNAFNHANFGIPNASVGSPTWV